MVSNATGLWDVSDYGSTPLFNAGSAEILNISKKDKSILKNLAQRVRSLSERDLEIEKKKDWILHNNLKPGKPLVICDPENGWNEIISHKDLLCENLLAKKWELVLKKEIFWGEQMEDDKVIEPYFNIGCTHSSSNWGLETNFHGGSGGSYVWDSPLKTGKDLEKLKFPEILIDHKTTKLTLELANDIFGNILQVRLKNVWWWTLGLTMDLAFLIGLEKVMIDMIDKPAFIHKAMQFLMQVTLMKLKYLEDNNLLSLNNDSYVGSGGFGYTTLLPGTGFEKNTRLIDMWGFGESQETTGISPSMFEEFIFRYQLPILSKFGLNCYGCCEPLEKRWHIIKQIPNLRRVSVSSWADYGKMADNLQDKYIYSLKAKPTDLAQSVIDEDVVRRRIKDILEKCKGCIIEIIMKDNHTIGNNPANVIRWVQIAKEEASKFYE